MNFSEAVFYVNYLTSDFHSNTVISRLVCLLVKMALKTVIRPIKIHRSISENVIRFNERTGGTL